MPGLASVTYPRSPGTIKIIGALPQSVSKTKGDEIATLIEELHAEHHSDVRGVKIIQTFETQSPDENVQHANELAGHIRGLGIDVEVQSRPN